MAVKEAKVTMIGSTASGKTTYLLGMYSVLSAGLQGYSVITKSLDDDVDMSDAWDSLCDRGEVPKPTDDPKLYSFIFRQRGQTLLTFEWEDYRGGAMSDKTTAHQDVPKLHTRLEQSDAIYLVLNGTHLAGTSSSEPRKLQARKMNGFLNHTLHERERRNMAPPSFVIMITKADMIRQANPNTPAEDLMDMICKAAEDCLPECFNVGLHTLVCPVQIGEFGQDMPTNNLVDGTKVKTRNLAYPMIHTFLNHLDSYTQGERSSADRLEGTIDQSAKELAAFENSWRAIFQPRKVTSAKLQIQEEERRLRELREALAKADSQVARLAADLNEAMIRHRVAVYEDGDRLG